jgi:hypothetical protein
VLVITQVHLILCHVLAFSHANKGYDRVQVLCQNGDAERHCMNMHAE